MAIIYCQATMKYISDSVARINQNATFHYSLIDSHKSAYQERFQIDVALCRQCYMPHYNYL